MPASALGTTTFRKFLRDSHLLLVCSVAALALLAFSACSSAQTSPALQPVSASRADAPRADSANTIVIGFLGGHVDHANPHHIEVQLANKLRDEFGAGVDVETFENRRYTEAYDRILTLLGSNRDGRPSSDEKRRARIILYGHSWGAAAVVALARELESSGIPVRLTVQVDSIPHFGQDDSVIPANVAKAANFYQSQGTFRGEPAIKPADPAHTQILGNFRFDYSSSTFVCEGFPWWDRYFMKAHTEIECDPKVWSQVENLIRAELPPATATVAIPAVASNPPGAAAYAKP